MEVTYFERAAQTLFAPALFFTAFYKADTLLSARASQALSEAIRDVASNPQESEWRLALDEFLANSFPSKGDPVRLFKSIIVMTTLSLLFFLALYTSRTSGLLAQILSEGFLTQFIFDGFLVTLAVNYYSYTMYRPLIDSFSATSLGKNVLWVLADFCVKAVLFTGLTAVVYVLFALFRGSFGGNIEAALTAVPITILQALTFNNLTSVYVYSLLLSSLPLFIAMIIKLMVLNKQFKTAVQRIFFTFPIADKPIRLATMIFSGFCGVFCLVISAMLAPAIS